MISIKTFVFNPFSENTYILSDETEECAIIDPGCYEQSEKDEIAQFIEDQGLTPVLLINTHCHIDHVLGNDFVSRKYKIPLQIFKEELSTLKSVTSYAASYGFPNYQEVIPQLFLSEDTPVKFGNSKLDVLYVPGHSAGHIALINKDQNICIAGDVLFDGSIGRTDLPGGQFETLINSIQQKLFDNADQMVVYPGHGPTTTIGKEKSTNPFCAVSR
jgi:glyoxylase-like metal-dependent hydrolase (beta-lactamase superfamily II)